MRSADDQGRRPQNAAAGAGDFGLCQGLGPEGAAHLGLQRRADTVQYPATLSRYILVALNAIVRHNILLHNRLSGSHSPAMCKMASKTTVIHASDLCGVIRDAYLRP